MWFFWTLPQANLWSLPMLVVQPLTMVASSMDNVVNGSPLPNNVNVTWDCYLILVVPTLPKITNSCQHYQQHLITFTHDATSYFPINNAH